MDPNTRALALWLMLEVDATTREAERVRSMPRISGELRGKAHGLHLVLERMARQQGHDSATEFITAMRAMPEHRLTFSEGDNQTLECQARAGAVHCTLRRGHPGWHVSPLGHRWAPENSDEAPTILRAMDGDR